MTKNDQRIALAKFCYPEYKDLPIEYWHIQEDDYTRDWVWIDKSNDYCWNSIRLPNYQFDLNAIHEAEKLVLESSNLGSSRPQDHEPLSYTYELQKAVGVQYRQEQVISGQKKPDGTDLILTTSVYASPFEAIKLIHVTAEQKLEALVKALGLWKEINKFNPTKEDLT